MHCKYCGKELLPSDFACSYCGRVVRKKQTAQPEHQPPAAGPQIPQLPNVQRTVRVTRVEAPKRQRMESEPRTQNISLIDRKRQRREDVLFRVLVGFLVLLALISASLCILLLTRGPHPETWFEKPAASAQQTGQTSALTPIPEKELPTPVPSESPVPSVLPTASPTPLPTATPTPAPTSTAEGKSALEALLLQGMERNYAESELEDLSEYELSILRNGMYAYSGLSFKKSQYKDFFSDCSWYEPNTSDDEKVYKRFNAYQKKNVATILAVEKEKGYR